MARNASGTYTLPSGNPVVSGTLIDATWANNTLSDLGNEMTDSLSRSGEGAMLAPLRITDGVQATPSLAFSNEPSSGVYRAGSNEWWAVAAGVQNLRFTNTGLTTRAAAGAVGTPSIAAFNDTDTGIYFPGANELAIATGGAARMTFDSAGAVAVPGTFSVTGNFAVDTSTLFVDASANFVGIGTASPAQKLDVLVAPAAASAAGMQVRTASISAQLAITGATYNNYGVGANTVWLFSDTSNLALGPYGGTGSVQFVTGGSLRATLDQSGNLGIGTASPAYKLDVRGVAASGNGTITTGFSWDTRGLVGTFSNHSLGFLTNGAVVGTWDTSGNLGLGVTPSAWGSSYKGLQVTRGASLGSNDANSLVLGQNWYIGGADTYITSNFASAYQQINGQHRFYTAPSGTAGNAITFTQAMTLTASGQLELTAAAPRLAIAPATGTNSAFAQFNNSASGVYSYVGIDSSVGGLGTGGYSMALWHGANYPLVFGTNNTERGRFTAGGAFLVNSTSVYETGDLARFQGVTAFVNDSKKAVSIGRNVTTGTLVEFFYAGAGGKGTISTDGTNVAYNTTSDYRLKTLISSVTGSGERVDALNPVEFEWKDSGRRARGFFAHEFQQVYSSSVTGEKDEVDAEGKPVYQAMQASTAEVIADLVAEIQSLRSRVAALEAQ